MHPLAFPRSTDPATKPTTPSTTATSKTTAATTTTTTNSTTINTAAAAAARFFSTLAYAASDRAIPAHPAQRLDDPPLDAIVRRPTADAPPTQSRATSWFNRSAAASGDRPPPPYSERNV
ncbi:hypothetical protein DFJ73DRAFT_766388 [Zopfochytrium polystomum]|nr:hypothetical protein DFJ73DRAFT_766388 [Zopfochytrium polystomum]